MNTHKLLIAAAVSALLGVASGSWAAGGGKRGIEQGTFDLSDAERATMLFMREEEKLARDVYITLYGIHGAEVFARIMDSEQQHFEAMGRLILKYDVTDPATPDISGVFQDQKLQTLYDELVTKGALNLLNALNVGGFIEETDMDDLANAIDESDQPDLDETYFNLREGSKNHLRAFVTNIEALGETYEAQHLSAEEVEAILDETRVGGPRR